MIVTKKVSVGGSWGKLGKDFEEGDVLVLLSEGDMVPGDFGERLVFKVRASKSEFNLSLNQTSINYLVDAYGENTSLWKGKEVKVWVVDQNVQGKMKAVAYLTAPTWKKIRLDGELKFVPADANKEIKMTGEIDESDLPF